MERRVNEILLLLGHYDAHDARRRDFNNLPIPVVLSVLRLNSQRVDVFIGDYYIRVFLSLYLQVESVVFLNLTHSTLYLHGLPATTPRFEDHRHFALYLPCGRLAELLGVCLHALRKLEWPNLVCIPHSLLQCLFALVRETILMSKTST